MAAMFSWIIFAVLPVACIVWFSVPVCVCRVCHDLDRGRYCLSSGAVCRILSYASMEVRPTSRLTTSKLAIYVGPYAVYSRRTATT